jgi:hypothetical protein
MGILESEDTVNELSELENATTDLAPPDFRSGLHVESRGALSMSELTALGVLALEAAERAHEAGNHLAAQSYCTIAHKCDQLADKASIRGAKR